MVITINDLIIVKLASNFQYFFLRLPEFHGRTNPLAAAKLHHRTTFARVEVSKERWPIHTLWRLMGSVHATFFANFLSV